MTGLCRATRDPTSFLPPVHTHHTRTTRSLYEWNGQKPHNVRGKNTDLSWYIVLSKGINKGLFFRANGFSRDQSSFVGLYGAGMRYIVIRIPYYVPAADVSYGM